MKTFLIIFVCSVIPPVVPEQCTVSIEKEMESLTQCQYVARLLNGSALLDGQGGAFCLKEYDI